MLQKQNNTKQSTIAVWITLPWGSWVTPIFQGEHIWVEFVVGSLLCSEMVFLWVLQFSPLLKNQHFKLQFDPGMYRHF